MFQLYVHTILIGDHAISCATSGFTIKLVEHATSSFTVVGGLNTLKFQTSDSGGISARYFSFIQAVKEIRTDSRRSSYARRPASYRDSVGTSYQMNLIIRFFH